MQIIGASSTTTERVLLSDVPEVADANLQEKVETFVATVFVKHLLPDISRRVGFSLNQDESDSPVRRFVVAGLEGAGVEGGGAHGAVLVRGASRLTS